MMAAGMTLARIKMADYNQENALDMIRNIRRASDAYSKTIGRVYQLPIALDLKGPDIRTGSFKDVKTISTKVLFKSHSLVCSLKLDF